MKDGGDSHQNSDDFHEFQSICQGRSGLQRVMKTRTEPEGSPAKIHKI